jgi:3-hydroxybutyrate dehydrogenase
MFHTMLVIMVEGPFRLIRSARRTCTPTGYGRIVNASSVHGLRASADNSAYANAKPALEELPR